MIHMPWRYLMLICLGLLVCISVVACQAPQLQCCDITYGLLKQTELKGQWDLAKEVTRTLMDSVMRITRYTDTPVAQQAKQYLVGTYGPQSQAVTIIHDLRRYEPDAPQLDEIGLDAFQDARAGVPFDPNVSKVGDTSQVQCQSSNPANPEKSITVCVAEVRYKRYISIMYFTFSRLISEVDMQEIINQALSKTDQRIQQLEQHE